jgi:hypothetical protein
VLGPLPPLHRWAVCALVLLTCVGLGAWIAWTVALPRMLPAGVVAGCALGIALVVLLLRDDSARPGDTPK